MITIRIYKQKDEYLAVLETPQKELVEAYGVKTQQKGKSAAEALEKMSHNFNKAGYLE